MGITIHYRGQLLYPANLAQLVHEVQLARGRLVWPCQVIDERVIGTAERARYHEDPDDDTVRVTVETRPLDDRWRGVAVQPPGCETLWLTTNRSGSLIVYDLPFEERDTPGRYHVRDRLSVKTQFTTSGIHIEVCSLLSLVERHMSRFEVMDEGGYWESRDQEMLVVRMEELNAAMDMLSSEVGRDMMEELLGHEVKGEVEVGKRMVQHLPPWR